MGDKQNHHRPSNEGKTCDAVIKVLEQRTGHTRVDMRRPEKDGCGPPVELRLKLGTQEYAIEHTQIEAFERQIATGVSLEELIEPVKRELARVLPGPALYEMIFPIDPSLGLKKSGLQQLQKSLIEWVHEKAQFLHVKIHERIRGKTTGELAWRDLNAHIKEKPPSVPYEITLNCWINRPFSEQEPGMLGAKRWAPDDKDLEFSRAKRLLQALSRKSPKLQRCKQEGARTVLVLESEDIALTSYIPVGLALDDLLMFAQYSVRARHAAPAPARHLLCSKATLYSAGINKGGVHERVAVSGRDLFCGNLHRPLDCMAHEV